MKRIWEVLLRFYEDLKVREGSGRAPAGSPGRFLKVLMVSGWFWEVFGGSVRVWSGFMRFSKGFKKFLKDFRRVWGGGVAAGGKSGPLRKVCSMSKEVNVSN